MTTTPKPPSAPTAGTGSTSPGSFRPEAHRRPPEPPVAAPRRQGNGEAAAGGGDSRRMFVGRDISMSGEISSCDQLLVEGSVEARLRESRQLEITETGSFKGAAEVDDADISGRFEGELIVHGRLRVRASGRIDGHIQYGELEVESGGHLVGDIHVSPQAVSPQAVSAVAAVRPGAPPDTARLAGFPSVPPASAASRGAAPEAPPAGASS